MFICKNCLVDYQWDSTGFRSEGPCEICSKQAICADIPSKYAVLKSDKIDPNTGEIVNK